MRAVRIAAGAAALAIALAACGGDGDDDDDATVSDPPGSGAVGDEQAYADAFTAGFQQGNADGVVIDADQAGCIGPRFVEILRVERLQEAGVVPADVATGADLDLSALGLDEDEGNDLYDAFGACDVDLRETLVGAMAADDSIDADARACFEDAFTDDVVRQFFVAAMVQGADAEPSYPGAASIDEIVSSCLGSVTGSVPTTPDG
jgi:hypothetical protein